MSLTRSELEALSAHPEDDALRRVLADRLMEQGDPRGEFIALTLKRPFSAATRKRAAKLFARNRLAWLGPLAPLCVPGTLGGRSRRIVGEAPFDGGDGSEAEVWDRGFPGRLQGVLTGTTVGALEWLPVREVVLLPPPAPLSAPMPRELEVATTPNLRMVMVMDDRWDEDTVEWAQSVRAWLRSVGRQAVLETRTEWPLADLAASWSVVG